MIKSKIAAVFLFCAGLFCLAQAQVPMTGAGKGAPGGGAGCSFNATTCAWIAAVVSAGSTVSNTEGGFVNTLTNCYTSNGVLSILDRDWLFASENATQANIDIINLQTWVLHGSYTFTANTGYAGDGVTGYGDLNFIPSSAGGHFTVSSATMSVYILTNRTLTANITDIGTNANAGGSPTDLQINAFGSMNIYELSGVGVNTTGSATAKGFYLASVTSSGAGGAAGYMNGTSVGTSSGASAAIAQDTFYVSALNLGGTAIQNTTDQIAGIHIGGGMNSTQAIAYQTCKNAYMTSLGINVY